MFKKIKEHISLQRRIQHEVLETLATICLYLERDGHYDRNPYREHLDGHFIALKGLSKELRTKEN